MNTVKFTRPKLSNNLVIYVYLFICMRRDKIRVVAGGGGKPTAASYLYCTQRYPTPDHLFPSGITLFPRYYHITVFTRAEFNRYATRNKQGIYAMAQN
jgi:hypothetical protein